MAKAKTKIKLKTRKSTAKRIKITGTGKVMRRKGWKGHLLVRQERDTQETALRRGGTYQR